MPEPTLQARYEELPYRAGAFPQTHPARIGAIARLFGVPAALPDRARVLELGAGCGLNLLPLAAMFPAAQFTGMDLNPADIAEGRRLAAAAGLTNLRLAAADVRDFATAPESFDYIVAHGVFSHVPDDAKAAILACCGRALAPHGVAYISYNTYPGWKARETLRDLLNLRLRGVEGREPRLANARATLAFLRSALADARTPPALAMRALAADMEKKDPMVFYHDELGPINDPCYLTQFVEWAGEHGLRYLGDAQLPSMLPPALPAGAAAALPTLAPGQVEAEQLLDYVRQRTFRCTLLVRAGAPGQRGLVPAALRDCAFGTQLRSPVAVPNLTGGHRVHFRDPAGATLNTDDAAAKALLCALAAAWPRRPGFAEACAATGRLLGSAAIPVAPDLAERLTGFLLDLAVRGLVDFLLASELDCAGPAPETAEVDAVARTLAVNGLTVANRWHEAVQLDATARQVVSKLDGTMRPWSADERTIIRRLAAAGLLKAIPTG